jgi:peptidyl-prolyl cis-trans isomerase SurA
VHDQTGYRILKVLSRDSPGQRELNDPRVQTDIRDILRNRKDQVLREAYTEVVRDSAKVENFLARKVIENAGKK